MSLPYASRMSERRNEEQRVIALVWPDGMPDYERVILEGLLPDMRVRTLNRLEAAWRAENGEDWRPLAAKVGLSRAAFYNLRAAWRERSLQGVIPLGSRVPRRIRTDPDSSIRKLARQLLIEDRMASDNAEIARALLEAAPKHPDIGGSNDQTRLQWAVRMLQHERAALAKDPHYLRANFGRRIAVDLSAVAIAMKGENELAVGVVCIDGASRMIIGNTIGRLAVAIELQRSAVEDARIFLARHRLDRDPLTWPVCDLDLMLPPGLADLREVDNLSAVTGDLELRLPGRYVYGREIRNLIGPRIGRLPVSPRKTLGLPHEEVASSRSVVVLDPKGARTHWEGEVLRHNAPIFRALIDADMLGKGVKRGRIADVLEAIDGVLLTSLHA